MSDGAYAVVMPVYNEEENIKEILGEWVSALKDIDAKFLIVNDGSRDNSLKMLNEAAEQHPNVIVFNKENTGHGQSCIFGYGKAVEMGFDYIFQTDSDGQTDPKDFLKYHGLVKDNRLVLGYRSRRGDGLARLVISRVLSLVVFLVTGVFVKDSNVPFRFFQRGLLAEVIKEIPSDFYLANIPVAVKAVKMNAGCRFVDISFRRRTGGKASVEGWKLLKLAVGLIKDFKKTKI